MSNIETVHSLHFGVPGYSQSISDIVLSVGPWLLLRREAIAPNLPSAYVRLIWNNGGPEHREIMKSHVDLNETEEILLIGDGEKRLTIELTNQGEDPQEMGVRCNLTAQ